jgi:thymidylate synthase (FAD)
MFCVEGKLAAVEINSMYDKLFIFNQDNEFDISELCLSNEAKIVYSNIGSKSSDDIYMELQNCKAKRNAGDQIKFIVTDTWLTDVVSTINLRSLKNFLELRNSGSAWQPMQHLAQLIEEATPDKYLKLISKKHKEK